MDFALFSRKSVLALMGLTLGVSAAFYVRRLVNPYAAAYPVAAIWLITLLLLTLGVVATLKVQWRSSGIGLLVAVGSFLAAFGLSSMALETREQELLEIVQGASVRVYLKPGTDEDQLTAFLCQYVEPQRIIKGVRKPIPNLRVGDVSVAKFSPFLLVLSF
jgi:hypothetical protein